MNERTNDGGTIGMASDLQFIGHGFESCLGTAPLHCGFRQATHTQVSLSPSSVTWYWSKGCNTLWLGM